MARKDGTFDGFREAASRAKPFATRYYTADTHRGALALPPYVQDVLAAV